MKIKVLILGFFLLLSTAVFCQNLPLSTDAKVSILTCEKGSELYSLYGHTALRISDPNLNLDIIFNYGAFDFSTPNFYLKFIKGDLQYFVTTNQYADFLEQYTFENRAVYEQQLLLTNLQKQQLLNNLTASLLTDDRFYTYKYIDRNCTTMVMDKVNEVLQDHKIPTKQVTKLSYREILYGYQKNLFFENLGINIIFGTLVDHIGSQIFLPKDLLLALNQQPLVSKKAILLNNVIQTETSTSSWNTLYFFGGLMLLLTFLSQKRVILLTFLIVMGLMGLFFSIVGLYSFHKEVLWNYNVMLFNPLFLILAILIIRKRDNSALKLTIFCLVILLVYTVYVATKLHLLIVLPIIIPTLVVLLKIVFKKRNIMPIINGF